MSKVVRLEFGRYQIFYTKNIFIMGEERFSQVVVVNMFNVHLGNRLLFGLNVLCIFIENRLNITLNSETIHALTLKMGSSKLSLCLKHPK